MSIDDALQFAVTRVCENTGWPLGHAYIVTAVDGGKRLHSTAIWHSAGTERMRDFHRETEATDFDPAVGLPGRVLATGAPAWIADVTEDRNFPRIEAARLAGIRAAFAFPVLTGSEVVAVLEFFSEMADDPNEIFLRLVSQIGTSWAES